MEKLVGELGRHPIEGGPERLTARESKILALVAEGLTHEQIGKVLDISTSTARTHVQSIIQKLGVSNRTQAAVKAVQGRSATSR